MVVVVGVQYANNDTNDTNDNNNDGTKLVPIEIIVETVERGEHMSLYDQNNKLLIDAILDSYNYYRSRV